MKIGLIGTGTIGTFLLDKINTDKIFPSARITAVFDEREKAKTVLPELASTYGFSVFQEIDSFLEADIDVIVECANVEVVKKYAAQILQKKELIIISIGALVDPLFHEKLQTIAKLNNQKLHLPSGAIGGLDVIKAAKVMDGLDTVTLVTRKPFRAFSIEPLSVETTIFEGSAKDAISKFPKNANVAITLSLAGIGVDKTNVKIIADPNVDKNLHQIEAHGDFGKLTIKIENNPSPTNPKTSYLTGLSILSILAQ